MVKPMALARRSSGRALQRRNWDRVQSGGPRAEKNIRHRCLCRKDTLEVEKTQGA